MEGDSIRAEGAGKTDARSSGTVSESEAEWLLEHVEGEIQGLVEYAFSVVKLQFTATSGSLHIMDFPNSGSVDATCDNAAGNAQGDSHSNGVCLSKMAWCNQKFQPSAAESQTSCVPLEASRIVGSIADLAASGTRYAASAEVDGSCSGTVCESEAEWLLEHVEGDSITDEGGAA